MPNYPHPEIGEETFKNSKWTLFTSHACYPFSPFKHVAIQAPRKIAKELIYKLFGESPDGENCGQHGSRNWDVSDDEYEDLPGHWAKMENTNSILTITSDAIGYYINGIWELPGYELKRYHRGNSPTHSLLSRLVHELKLRTGAGHVLGEEVAALLLEFERQPL